MKTTWFVGTFILLFSAICLTGCNDDEEEFSRELIQQVLFDMKGTYYGTLTAGIIYKAHDASFDDVKTISYDSLRINIPLSPIARDIDDELLATTLREIGSVEYKAGYKFYQIDDGGITAHFILCPKDNFVIPVDSRMQNITFVFADNYGGSFSKPYNSMVYNVSIKEIWVGETKLDSFQQWVYHYEGSYE